MKLIKTSLINGIAVVIKILASLGLNKVLAIYVGPAGYAAIGQFQNVITMITTFASGAVNTGVTKYTAEYFDDETKQHTLWRTAGTISVCGALFASTVIAIFHQYLARLILNNQIYGTVFLWLAATLVLFVLNGLLLSILNGKKEVHRYVVVSIANSIVSLIVTGLLARFWGLYGALVALAINQSIVFFVTIVMCKRAGWIRLSHIFGRVDTVSAINLGKYTLMAITTAVTGPTSQIIIRNHLSAKFGTISAGNWQAVTKISDIYLLLVTSTLSVYYLPRLSEIRDSRELTHEIIQGYKIILPVTVIGAGIIYLLRDWIIMTLFTSDFVQMRELIAWQLCGDVAKIGSWLLAYLMLSRAMVRTFIITEIIFNCSFVGLSILFTMFSGLNGVTISYFISYVLYWLVMIYIIIRHIKSSSYRILV